MIQFKEFRITPNDEKVFIEVQIAEDDYYSNIVIDSIVIDTQDTYVDNGPSVNNVYSVEVNSRNVRLELDNNDLPIKGNILFVYIITSGEFATNTPSELKSYCTIGTLINTYPIYKNAMYFTRELANNNEIPREFIDQILKIKALDLAFKTGNHQGVIKYWNKLFKALRR